MRLPLNNQSVTASLMFRVRDILESERDRINTALSVYQSPKGGGPLTLGDIYVGRRPSRSTTTFPNIVIIATTRSPQWNAHRETLETVTFRFFCNVEVMDNDAHEEVMLTLTDVVESVLMQNPIVMWQVVTGTPPELTLVETSTAEIGGVSYGLIDNGYLKSGQIDWGCQFLLPWNDINYVTDIPIDAVATGVTFEIHPSDIAVTGIPLARQPVVVVSNAEGSVVPDFLNNITLRVKDGTGTTGAALIGTINAAPLNGVFVYTDIAINTPGNGYVLQAVCEGLDLPIAESTPINVYARPQQIVLSAPDSVSAGAPFSVSVMVEDTNRIAAYGYNGLVALQSTGPLQGVTVVEAVHGVATLPGLSFPTAGDYTVAAYGYGLQSEAAPITAA